MRNLILLLISLIFLNCSKEDCFKSATKEKLSVGSSYKTLSAKALSNSKEAPYLFSLFNLDSLSGIIHSVAKYDSLELKWIPKYWITFESRDVIIHKNRRLLLSTINTVIYGSVIGEGTIEIKYNSTLIIQGSLDDRITMNIEEGSELIIDTPLGEPDIPKQKYIIEVPCSFKLPQEVLEDGIWWAYKENKLT